MANEEVAKIGSLEGMKKQAKSLLKDCKQGDGVAVDIIRRYHPAYSDGKNLSSLKLQEVQYALACKNGYRNWSELLLGLHERTSSPNPRGRVLLFTNGEQAAEGIRKAGSDAEIVAWNDVLHEGPVSKKKSLLAQSEERVRHLASLGWVTEKSGKNSFRLRDQYVSNANTYDRIELWFEHDLYDLLQLVQILAELGRQPELRGKIWLNQFGNYIENLKQPALIRAIDSAVLATEEVLIEARVVWDALRDSNPFELQNLLKKDFKLKFLSDALMRWCEEFPNGKSELPRSLRQILEEASQGPKTAIKLFINCQKREEAIYMGDASFWILVKRLLLGKSPLLEPNGKKPLIEDTCDDGVPKQKLKLSEAGESVLEGKIPWSSLKPDPYFLGGVELFSEAGWRFDPENRQFHSFRASVC
ncbi:hypothetical protein MLD52_06370 [Puniceicoccaceae bacterium K14]|nr:hypothetical protein [Puniceicoccaceae bacterium K14]